jgi:glycosyltransferase involved in cell wall biosynthesis
VKIVHLEAGANLYGGALQVLLLVEGLVRRGIDSVLVTAQGGEPEAEAQRRGLPVRSLPLSGEADLAFLLRFKRLVHEEGPDLVHLHSRRGADTLGAVAARWAGTRTLLSRRVDNPEPGWIVGPKYRLFHGVITISRAIQNVLVTQGVPAQKVRCVHSALDGDPFHNPCKREEVLPGLGVNPTEPVVAMAAQFIPRKGHEVLLAAIPHVLERHPSARFLLFGKGPLQGRIGQEIARLGLADHVLLPGFRGDLPRILPCLDLLVHPALREGLGIILLQASASGLPIVATEVGGIPEAVANGDTGLLVPPGNPRKLAEAVVQLLDDPDLRKSMGSRGKRKVAYEFSVDRMVEGNLAVYREVLSRTN